MEFAAIAATRGAVGGKDFAELVALIERERGLAGRRRGRPPQWLACQHPARELAGAIFYAVVESRLRAQNEFLPPFALTVAGALGFDIVPNAPEATRRVIGMSLLGLAESTGLIETLADDGIGVRVRIRNPTFKRLQRIVNGAGADVRNRVRFMRPSGIATKLKHEMRLPRSPEPLRVIEAADKVQGTAWRINKRVLAALQSDQLRMLLDTNLTDGQKMIRLGVIAQAVELQDEPQFYFPCFLDFRGRLYQRGTFITYTSGSDYARGLLEFADGEIVDDAGAGWLAWHMAQMWGWDLPEMPFGDGRQWADAVSAECHWQGAKHPTQFLAARMAYERAQRGQTVHVPIRLDASCSGLQHLALLTRDAELGALVNLSGDTQGARRDMAWLELRAKPDFYAVVGENLEVPRDLVKLVVVPLLYGAGEAEGAANLAEDRTQGRSRRASKADHDLAGRIAALARALAPRAFGLLKWLTDVAAAHNRIKAPIRWSTPSGFECIQDYRYVSDDPKAHEQVGIRVNGRRVQLVLRHYTSAIDQPQQVVALPANVVHSMDAALLTEIVASLACDRWAVAHDAFAVPPSAVWDLAEACEVALRDMYAADRVRGWMDAWARDGVGVPPMEVPAQLPEVMLGGLRQIS